MNQPNKDTIDMSLYDSSTFKMVSSVVILAILSGFYCFGLTQAVRGSMLLEVVVSLLLPLFFWAAKSFQYFGPRLLQLVVIESLFNILIILSRASIRYDAVALNEICGWGFVAFFVVQTTGFLVIQLKRKRWHGVFQSALFFGALMVWWWRAPMTGVIEDEVGRVLFWGEDAPIALQIFYSIWLINVLLVDSPYIPKLNFAVVNFASLAVALTSGEFFHVRLLTACHLFVLEGVFGYGWPKGFGESFGLIPKTSRPSFTGLIQPVLAGLCSLGSLLCFWSYVF